ncbi:MAG TPA: hypothetical protein VEA63_16640, partial [Opitutus sp.]|nr:hypothetical protein [Opitutus sp.]
RADLRSYRTARWKLVLDFLNPGRDELYDLGLDPAENVNLIDDPRPEARVAHRELKKMIHDVMRANRDPIFVQSASAP